MGGSLSSPLGSRPHHHVAQSTSVCNHLFAPPDTAALYLPSRQPHWPVAWQQRKNVHPEENRRERVLKLEEHSRAPFSVSSPRRDSHPHHPHHSHPRPPPYSSLSLSVDSNSNYNGYTPRSSSTVIPNLYTIAREGSHDALNNNNNNNNVAISPPTSKATTPLSPKHAPLSARCPTRILDAVEKEQRSARLSPTDKDVSPTVHAPLEVRRRTIMHASTSDLLRGIGRFVVKKSKVDHIDAAHVVMWMRAVDRSLLLQGWQDIAFINPANLVFVFLLMRDVDDDDECLYTSEGVHQWVLMCLYIAYSYMGNEISYPLKPFLIQKDKPDFWSKCVQLSLEQSADMLRLNSSSAFFTQVFADLKRYTVDS